MKRFPAFAFMFMFSGAALAAQDSLEVRLQVLAEQNRELQDQLQAQKKLLETLAVELRGRQQVEGKRGHELSEPKAESSERAAGAGIGSKVRVSGEAGFGIFRTGAAGAFPKSEFRADDPTIGLEVVARKGIYFVTDLRLLPRESNSDSVRLGEIYVDFENVSAAWGRPGLLSARAGRFNIPFGEEYQLRGPVANPLISHSLEDVWGVDEGIEAFGQIGPVNYVVAVQNGGVSRLHDFDSDKSITARVGGHVANWLSLSASALRTGNLTTVGDSTSEVWFGNGFFRALGTTATTSIFWASMFELDATARWRGGQLGWALGAVRFGDNDKTANNFRRMRYGHVELVQDLAGPLFTAARFSAIRVHGGYPLTGWGISSIFSNRLSLTEELRRFSVGMGYRLGDALVLKAEYTRESGRMTSGALRDREDFLGGEIAVKF